MVSIFGYIYFKENDLCHLIKIRKRHKLSELTLRRHKFSPLVIKCLMSGRSKAPHLPTALL